jgi:hypothetical protein
MPVAAEVQEADLVVLDQKKTQLVAQTEAFVIKTDDDFVRAADIRSQTKALRGQFFGLFDPLRDALEQAKSRIIEQAKKYYGPLDAIDKNIASKMSIYHTAKEEEAAKLRQLQEEEARKQAEDKRLTDALELEKAGKKEREEAERLRAEAKSLEDSGRPEEAAAKANEAEIRLETACNHETVVDEMLSVPIVSVPIASVAAAPKIAGLSFRTTWKTDESKIELALLVKAIAEGHPQTSLNMLTVNMTAINGLIRSLRDQCKIPGVPVYMEKIAVQ